MNEHLNEHYLLKHFETQHTRLVAEARRTRLKADLLAAARQQRPVRRLGFRLPTVHLLGMLRVALRSGRAQPELRDRKGLESSAT